MNNIKFTRGVPPTESFCPQKLSECANAVLMEHGNVVLQYGPSRGFVPLREIIARQANVDPARILVGQGSLQLLDLFARTFVRPGDTIYVEEPSYDRAVTVLKRAGGQIVGFPLADDGPDVDEIAERLEKGERPILFYVIPDFQNPSGKVMSEAKRRRLVELAQQYEFWLAEDAPYRRLRYAGKELPSLHEMAPDRVMQMSSYSKLISPGLRVGYTITPQPLVDRMACTAEDTYINASYLNQGIVYEFEKRGWLEPHLESLKQLYRPRLNAMLAALDQHLGGLATWAHTEGGFFVGVTLNAHVKAADLLKKAEEKGLTLTNGRGFFASQGGDNFVRLPFCALTPVEIQEGVARLADVVRTL